MVIIILLIEERAITDLCCLLSSSGPFPFVVLFLTCERERRWRSKAQKQQSGAGFIAICCVFSLLQNTEKLERGKRRNGAEKLANWQKTMKPSVEHALTRFRNCCIEAGLVAMNEPATAFGSFGNAMFNKLPHQLGIMNNHSDTNTRTKQTQ